MPSSPYDQNPEVYPTRRQDPWFAIAVGLIGVIVGFSTATALQPATAAVQPQQQVAQQPTDTTPEPEQPTGTVPAIGVGPTLGKDSAPITVVEFTDFQCPFCSRHFTQTFGQIKSNYIDTGKVKYELRHYPLGFHPNAQISAEASMCANKQGKFWEMHDELFVKQGEWSNLSSADVVTKFKAYAAELGLDATPFASCIDNGETKALVQADMTAAGPAGIDGTPGFWIIGPDGQTKQISGAYPYATFQTTFDEMLGS